MDCWNLLSKVLPVTPRVLLYGPPGTGKTFIANTEGLKKDQEVYQTTLTQDSTAAELLGHYVPNENGAFEWLDGLGVKAWKQGARLVINEIDNAGVDVMTFLHALLDDPKFAKFTLPNKTKEIVRPAEGFQVVATMNGVPDDLPEALADRFPVKLHMDKVNPKAIEQLPTELRGVYNDYTDNNSIFSVRKWIAFAELMNAGIDVKDASVAVFQESSDELIESLALQENGKAEVLDEEY
tara:strand:+ start:5344 stop:6057 length:714 start_codon:yes stop_codon:yes gene_type:complete